MHSKVQASRYKEKDNSQINLRGNFKPSQYSELDKLSESQIWEKFKNGERLAFTYVYSKNIQALYNFGCQFTSDKELVKDCLHDLFVKLRKPGKQTEILSIKSYLYKCLYRELIKRLSKSQLIQNPDIEENLTQVEFSPEHILINQQAHEINTQKLNKALKGLSNKQRQALMFFYYEDMTYKEIAEIFDMSQVKSARKLVYRAIDKLRNFFKAG